MNIKTKIFEDVLPQMPAHHPLRIQPAVTFRLWLSYQLLLLGDFLQKFARIVAASIFLLALAAAAIQVHFLLSHFHFQKLFHFRRSQYLEVAQQCGVILNILLIALLLAVAFFALVRWCGAKKYKKELKNAAQLVTECARGNLSLRLPEQGEMKELGSAVNALTANFSQAVNSLAERDDSRRQLIADISHDLLKPVASIQAYIETIMRKKDCLPEEELQEYLGTIQRSTKSLNSLVSDFLTLANLDGTNIKLNYDEFSIEDLAHDIYMKCIPLAAKKNITFDITPFNKLPLAYGDVKLIDRVLFNLVENAVQYTPADGKVAVNLIDDRSSLLVQVADSGPGISKEEQALICQALYRGKSASKANRSGHGLGLAIVHKILEVHQTPLFIKSKVGSGTTFSFKLQKACLAALRPKF